MQTVAPERPHPQLQLVRPARPLRVVDMHPGEHFFVPDHSTSVVALLTHSQIDIRDVTQIWVVIIASQAKSNDQVGHIFGVPHNAAVTPLTLVGAPRFAMGD